MTHRGGCHCGAVAFEVDAERPDRLLRCNCSICSLKGYLHWTVPGERFTLRTPRDALLTYTFNTGVARHYFCRTCGICSFYVPRSDPDAVSVNAHCVEGLDPEVLPVESFDGRNWEEARAARQQGRKRGR